MKLGYQELNGEIGENLTFSFLAKHLWILRRTPDVDGADFLVQIPADNLQNLRGRAKRYQAFGIVQAKFLERGGEARISKDYVVDENSPRDDFFCFMHTEGEDGRYDSYFFTAAEIANEFRLRNGVFLFSLTKDRSFLEFKNLPPKIVSDKITEKVKLVEAKRNRDFIESHFRILATPTAHYLDSPNFRYCLRILDGVRVATCQNEISGHKHLLEMRRDLFPNLGEFNWGTNGTGTQFLATSLLAHHFNGARPQTEQVDRLVSRHLRHLSSESEHTFRSEDLLSAICEDSLAEQIARDNERLEALSIRRPTGNAEAVRIVAVHGDQVSVQCACGFNAKLPSPWPQKTLGWLRGCLERAGEAAIVSEHPILVWAGVVRDSAGRVQCVERFLGNFVMC